MAKAAVFDTNVLPLSRGLSGVLWISIRKLCETLGVEIVLPDLVVQESVNLRRKFYLASNATFLGALRDISQYFDAESIYVPDVEEVCSQWDRELREAFQVLPIHGDDAAQALIREANRIRPAREGRGGRDSAIWMTVLRLAEKYETVAFISRNTKDFGTRSHQGLHPDLADEAGTASGSIEYFPKVEGFIEHLAVSVDKPTLEVEDVVDTLRFEIRDGIYNELTGSFPSLTPDQVDPASIRFLGVEVLRSYMIRSTGLALIHSDASIAIGNPRDGISTEFAVTAWIEYSLDNSDVTGEIVELRTH